VAVVEGREGDEKGAIELGDEGHCCRVVEGDVVRQGRELVEPMRCTSDEVWGGLVQMGVGRREAQAASVEEEEKTGEAGQVVEAAE